MDPNVLHLIVTGVLTVVAVVITALIWKRAQVKTVFWWIGLTLVPAAVYLAGLAPAVQGAYETLSAWWASLAFTPMQWAGLVLGGLAALLMFGSRLIPSESYRDRRLAAKEARAADKNAPKGTGTQAAPAPSPRPGISPSPQGSTASKQAAPPAKQGGGDEEFDEIAELLRKRGIN